MVTREFKILKHYHCFCFLYVLLECLPSQLLGHGCGTTGNRLSHILQQTLHQMLLWVQRSHALQAYPTVEVQQISLICLGGGESGIFQGRKAVAVLAFLHTWSMWWFQMGLVMVARNTWPYWSGSILRYEQNNSLGQFLFRVMRMTSHLSKAINRLPIFQAIQVHCRASVPQLCSFTARRWFETLSNVLEMSRGTKSI